MRTILLSKSDENYLHKCAVEHDFCYGIIIGQNAELDKYIVVHLAKNGEEDNDLPFASSELDSSSQGSVNQLDIDTQALTSQWVGACKMTPGSFVVLGIFISSTRQEIANEHTFKEGKRLFSEVHNLLIQGNHFCNSVEDVANADYVFLVYSTFTQTATCELYTQTLNGGTFSPMECRFVRKPFEWYTFECSYELEDVFPILETALKINLEHQFQRSIDSVKKSLAASEIFIDSEAVEDSQLLDTYIKTRDDSQKRDMLQETFRASIFLPLKCQISCGQPITALEFAGTIRFSGVISSRVWCNPKNTMGDVKRFVRDDILRSLAARIQVCCDGLTEPNIPSGKVFISEPPRRVYFNMPCASDMRPIQFSEYIFRGEAPTVAVAQAKQILDLDINSDCIAADLEGVAQEDDLSDASSVSIPMTESEARSSMRVSRSMYMLGILISVTVLVLSLILHYWQRT